MSDTEITTPKVLLNERARIPDETGAPPVTSAQSTLPPPRPVSFVTRGANALAPVIDIDRLYDAPAGTSSQIASALEMLKQAADIIAEAQRSASPMEADRFVQRLQLALPKLFTYRSIGDGFGLLINSLHFVFANLRGTPLTRDQLNVVWRVLRELRSRPAMSLEQAIPRVEELEKYGLEVDPPDLSELLEIPESAENE